MGWKNLAEDIAEELSSLEGREDFGDRLTLHAAKTRNAQAANARNRAYRKRRKEAGLKDPYRPQRNRKRKKRPWTAARTVKQRERRAKERLARKDKDKA